MRNVVVLGAGAAPCVRPGDGSEDEHLGQQQSQHAAGGAAHEQTIPPQHSPVTETFDSICAVLFIFPSTYCVVRLSFPRVETAVCLLCFQVHRRVRPRGAAARPHRGNAACYDYGTFVSGFISFVN